GLTFDNARTSKLSANSSPVVYRSESGLLDLALRSQKQQVAIGNRTATLLAYNGQVPGPILEARPGETVRIRFTNQLEQPTNLHFHGLHIPPTGNADNVFLSVPTGETQVYEFEIPSQHPGGLFWYHPHQHGLVAAQVFGGLAGALVIRGQVDEIPEVQAADEAILVLQDFDIDDGGQLREPLPVFRRWGRQGNLMTVNGTVRPTLTVPQSGLLRLRLLNASPSRIYQLRLDNHPWYLMGLDGGTLPEPVELETDLILAPGERADLLVPGTREPDTYTLLSRPYDRGIAEMMASMGHQQDGIDTAPYAIAHLQYGDSAVDVPLPQTLIPAIALPEPTQRREFVLDHGIDSGSAFLINGQGFNHHRIDTKVQLGTVEEWTIINKAGMDHPFHVHTNPFQVINQNSQPFPFQVWKDVVNIKAYESVDLRMAFTDFPGKSVYHCHILDHEDQGMMGILEIGGDRT
ncbi:MAG: multicopper oxidase family protein, partial [Leptolyngbyaceae cyanobacterium]